MPQPRLKPDAAIETVSETVSAPAVGISELLAAVARKHYNQIEDPKGCDGAQMWNCQWWMPLTGCDTLSNMLDDMAYAVERQQAANARKLNA